MLCVLGDPYFTAEKRIEQKLKLNLTIFVEEQYKKKQQINIIYDLEAKVKK